jgi:hypothetical protein
LRRADAFLTSTAAFLARRDAMQQGGSSYMVDWWGRRGGCRPARCKMAGCRDDYMSAGVGCG